MTNADVPDTNVGDLISRQALYEKMSEAEDLARQRVIDTPTSFPDGSLKPAYIRYMAQLSERTRFKEMIYDEPSVERKKGEWIDMNTLTTMYMPRYKCSICDEWANKSNYCPYCGADMRGEEEVE